jgi:hypothetical protein
MIYHLLLMHSCLQDEALTAETLLFKQPRSLQQTFVRECRGWPPGLLAVCRGRACLPAAFIHAT